MNPYGCHNHKPYPKGYWGTKRVYYPNGSWELFDEFIEHKMSRDCRYDLQTSDDRCKGCKHMKGDGHERASE